MSVRTKGDVTWSTVIQTPTFTSLQGITVTMQGVVAAGNSKIEFTNALQLTLGR